MNETSPKVTDTTTPAIFDELTRRDDWLGFGYLGGRRNALDDSDPDAPAQPETVAIADQMILNYAREHGWTIERLFAFCNHKRGRWFADEAFGGFGLNRAITQLHDFTTANRDA